MTDKGSLSFHVFRRMPGGQAPLRRTIGRRWTVPIARGCALPFSLAEVRQEARAALTDIASGQDPKLKREAALREAERAKENTFEAVAELFIAGHVSKLRTGTAVAAEIRNEMIKRWRGRSIGDIGRSDVTKMLREVAKDRPYVAHHLLANTRKLYNWAIALDDYGLTSSPCDRIKASEVIGARSSRDRVLEDRELKMFWAATEPGALNAPWRQLFRVLLLTGQRLREVAHASWSELDSERDLWTIPAKRMKGDAAHVVPLSSAVIDLLSQLPRGNAGDFIFSTTDGARPVSGFSKTKERLDRMLQEVEPWRAHDLRRTMRTGLGALPVPTKVAELTIAHAQPGMHRVYDRYAYLDEKRRALDLWSARLLAIVEPTPTNVVSLAAARG